VIEYVDGGGSPERASPEVEFVGGPRAGERTMMGARPEILSGTGGSYRRSVACVDDGSQRYVWSADPELEPDSRVADSATGGAPAP